MDRLKRGRLSKISAMIVACLCVITVFPLPSQAASENPSMRSRVFTDDVVLFTSPADGTGFTPNQIKNAYNLPSTGGSGVTIALIVAYDTPNVLDYLNTFSAAFGLPSCDSSNFEVHKMAETISSGDANDWSLETCLNVQWAHAIAPEAKILLVEAQGANMASYMLPAIDYATSQPGVVAVAMSWGITERADELTWDSHFNKDGIGFFASTGNFAGSVFYPSTSPYVVAVRGTVLSLNGDGSVNTETARATSSSGISQYEAMPAYQTNLGLNTKFTTNYRVVPDVSYNAQGYYVYYGDWRIVSGTSAGAPQMAAIHALTQTATPANLYQCASTDYTAHFKDITSGANAYAAGGGFDLASGLGTPKTCNFNLLISILPEGQGTAVIAAVFAAMALTVLVAKKKN
jgi:subtilase family serine protease